MWNFTIELHKKKNSTENSPKLQNMNFGKKKKQKSFSNHENIFESGHFNG